MLICVVQAEDIAIELVMPGTMYGPGSLFSLDLNVINSGSALDDAQLFVALSIGTGDFWFYPTWEHYPPDINWETVDIPSASTDSWVILPEFGWPSAAGEFDGAMFFAAIIHNGVLMSNLADFTFSWSEEAQPTPTPELPTSTPGLPTSTPGLPTSTPGLPTSTPMPTSTPELPTHTPGTPTPTPTPDSSTPTPPPAIPGYAYIPPGIFTMGSPETEPCRDPDETQHQVTLTRGFYMMQTEMSRQMWADLKEDQPSLPADPSNPDYSPTLDHPVQYTNWFEAILFSNLKSLQDGYTRCYYKDAGYTIPVDSSNYTSGGIIYWDFYANGYRLPTESEWEYACRAETTGEFSCNETNYSAENCASCVSGTLPALEQHCVFCTNDPGITAEVGSKLPNSWGLYDIHGNLWEWCWDSYGPYPSGPVTDPTGSVTGSYGVFRGGSWSFPADDVRSASRHYNYLDLRVLNLGFRLVRTVN